MMITSTPGDNTDYTEESIFLAGPSFRGEYDGRPHWRLEALLYLEKMGFQGVVFSPEPMRETYDKQVAWENQRLIESTVIVFWIPRNLEELPGFTTNVEFGEWMRSGKCVLGYPQGAPKMRYLHMKAQKYDMPVAHSLYDTLDLALKMVQT